jgi:hypothetical protein
MINLNSRIKSNGSDELKTKLISINREHINSLEEVVDKLSLIKKDRSNILPVGATHPA